MHFIFPYDLIAHRNFCLLPLSFMMTVICQCVPKQSSLKSGKALLETYICSPGSFVNTMGMKEHEFNNLHMQLWENNSWSQ